MFPCFVTCVIDIEDSTDQRIGIICLKLEPHFVVGTLKLSTIGIGTIFPLFLCEHYYFTTTLLDGAWLLKAQTSI